MKTVLSILSLYLVYFTSAQKSSVVADGASLEEVASGFSFTEGPAVDPKGNVYFTDQPNDRIHIWTPGEGVSLYLEGTGRSNGLYFDNDGNLLACADEHNQLWKFNDRKGHRVLVEDYEGLRLNGPNDLWVAPDGGIYFTDPFYKRKYWDHENQEIAKQMVYYITPDYKTVTIVASDLVKPNGIVGSRNGKTLYVADIGDKKTYVYDINKDGSLSGKKLFAEMGSDGMTIDNKGNVYLTGRGVTIFNEEGQKIEQIDVGDAWTANVCFGGRKQSILFITASKSVYTIDMKVKGVR